VTRFFESTCASYSFGVAVKGIVEFPTLCTFHAAP
jgi:hypothetical protein